MFFMADAHVKVGWVSNKGCHNFCSSGLCHKDEWVKFVKVLFGDNVLNNPKMGKWLRMEQMLKVDVQSILVCMEYGCGLVMLYLIKQFLFNLTDGELDVSNYAEDVRTKFVSFCNEMEKAEDEGHERKPKRLLGKFVTGCGLGPFKTRWQTKYYEEVRACVGNWACTGPERIIAVKAFGGMRFFLVKHLGYSNDCNTYVPEFCVPEDMIENFFAELEKPRKRRKI
ncbi:uncharacterized protein LOC129602537 isoform X2 [Paramacrobiotus metropolitanus]|uniref:uncharacterized protein LOC129602537 isoform X2 n=1 Tax=Paramacrobiotus metropolitanus TaxID=2943436 RepID=UPI00244586B3|nr:uncharacterized protein LOC129602537 isoform X2 [Paramacrobiotus metropolitanus]XP_055357556.1 uncharacterized protein LOC129602537 isoform X2 [Paramacrobiotus metropolitanus]XP_055357557.1 uncharacterized protein LOC129602537 isoform X2 [Paramacrobiotus metropolitanus]